MQRTEQLLLELVQEGQRDGSLPVRCPRSKRHVIFRAAAGLPRDRQKGLSEDEINSAVNAALSLLG